ncbi:MAG: GNAT family N-acetyltransferase [Desulfobacula sp.]|jgi:GNAT superfamily N-acetyltransferase|nr:GNAT family N-acetyltransferase [Desulfobacula sp.]
MEIREAIPEDNNALKELQAKCPQGTDLVATAINTPDFFSRAKAYKMYKVYVASEGDRILGSTACGFKNAIVNGKKKRIAYGFQAFVAPEYRRTGLASRLHQHSEDYAIHKGASLFYTLVIEKNTPAMRYIESKGFCLHRTVVMPGIAVYKQMDTASEKNVRQAVPEDLGALAELANQTWQNFELYEPLSAEKMSSFINRTPGYNLNNFLVLEENGKILAFLGYLDWGEVMQITVDATSLKIRMIGTMLKFIGLFKSMPKMVEPGDTLKQIIITLTGFNNPTYLALLLRYLNNQMFQQGINIIFSVCDRNNDMLKSLKGFIRIDTALNLYIKNFQQDELNADKPVFINGVDM